MKKTTIVLCKICEMEHIDTGRNLKNYRCGNCNSQSLYRKKKDYREVAIIILCAICIAISTIISNPFIGVISGIISYLVLKSSNKT